MSFKKSFLIKDILQEEEDEEDNYLNKSQSIVWPTFQTNNWSLIGDHSNHRFYGLYYTSLANNCLQNNNELDLNNNNNNNSNNNNNNKEILRKVRRNRTVFTELQLMGLERRFDSQKYLSTPDRAELARALGLTQLQVKTWYQNRRMKWKKQVMQGGCPIPPTKPKGRPKKNSIPTFGLICGQNFF